MRLFTNVGSQNYGEYFVVTLGELRENYRGEKLSSPDDFPYQSFNDYLENSDWNELSNDLTTEYTANVRNKICRVTVKIDSKKTRNLIDYEEEII